MAKLGINTGSSPNDGTGDSLLDGAVKINSNFNDLYTLLGDGYTLPAGIVTTIAAGSNISISGGTGTVTITGIADTARINAESVNTIGIVTASSFDGNLAATNLTGTIDDARLPNTITSDITGDVTGNLTGNVTGNTSGTTVTASGKVTGGSFVGDGTAVTGIVTGIVAGDNITVSGATGTVTITGVAATTNVVTNNLTAQGITTVTNQIQVKSSDSTPGRIDYYCESNNAHYTRVQAPPHATYSGNNTVILPVDSGTLLNTDGDGSALTGIVTGLVAGSNISLSNSGGTYTITGTGGGGGGAGGAGSLIIGYGSTDGDTPVVVGTATTINFVGTGYTVSVANSVATVRNVAMGMTSIEFTSVSYGTTVNAGSQISYTATANDANAKFHVESAPAGIGQIGINYDSGVMGGGQNATAGTYIVNLRAATNFGLSEPYPVSFTVDPFTLSMNTMFGDPTTFVMNTDASDDAVYTSLSSGGVVSYDGSNYVIDRTNANYGNATNHALYYDNTNNVLYGFRTNSSNNAISGIYKWTSVTSASHGTSVGSGSAQQFATWASSDAVSEVSALHGTKTYNTLTLNASIDDFDGAYTRQTFKAKLDTGTVSSGNALFAEDSGYWWFLKDGDNSRMIIYSGEDSSWAYVYVSGANFSTAANNTAVGSANAVETQAITGVVYDDAALQPESEYSEITYPGSVGIAAYQPGGNYTNFYGSAFAMTIATSGGIMNNFGTGDTDWAYGFTLEDPWLITGAGNQLLAPESAANGWHNFGIALFNISSTEYDYVCYGADGYGPYTTGSFIGGWSRLSNTNNIANAGDTVQVRFDGTTNGNYYLYINGVLKLTTSSPDTYMSNTNTTNPTLSFGDTSNQNGGTIINDYAKGMPWPFRIRDMWIANNGNISASDLSGVASLNNRNVNTWSEYSDVDVYFTMDASGVTAVKGSPTVARKSITFS